MSYIRNPISKRTRALVLSRDKNRCRMCGRTSQETSIEVDHVFPSSKGGSDDLDNLSSLCKDCNIGKSDLLLMGMLKQKIESGDFTPIGKVELEVSYAIITYGEGRQHEYRLIINVFNNSSKTIVNPQLEIKLPDSAIQTVSSRGQITKQKSMAKVFFAKLDVDKIHPQKKESLMETSNIGLIYKVNCGIYYEDSLMNSDFEVSLYAEDMNAVVFKKKFTEMQCF